MTVDRLESIERVPLAIDYRRLYRAAAVIEVGGRTMRPATIEFALELSPFGGHEITVSFIGATEYPIVPAIRILKEHIRDLERNRQLP